MKTWMRALLTILLCTTPLPAMGGELPDDTDEGAMIALPVSCAVEVPAASTQTPDQAPDLAPDGAVGQVADLETGEPIAQLSCLEGCQWYCYNEYQFCLSGCSDALCQFGCIQQHNECGSSCYIKC